MEQTLKQVMIRMCLFICMYVCMCVLDMCVSEYKSQQRENYKVNVPQWGTLYLCVTTSES